MYFTWLPDYSVEVEEIDGQHKRFVLLLNDLYDTVEVGCEEIVLGDIISQLVAYADYHFATEEKYFDQFSFPGGESHKQIHADFRKKVKSFQKSYLGKEDHYAKKVLEFMKDWLANHILTVDQEYAEFFHEHGLK